MNPDRKLRTPARVLMALPVAALALSLAACGASRPTEKQLTDGLIDYYTSQSMSDQVNADAAACFAGYLLDSKLSNETLSYIAQGKDQASSVEDRDLTVKILKDNFVECTT